MDKILVTGGTGLIGSHFIKEALNDSRVYSVQRGSLASDNPIVVRGDLSGEIDFRSFPSEIDAVVYLAQSENFRLFPDRAEEVFQVNTMNLLHVLEYARKAGAKKIIYASSGGVYGNSGSFEESSPLVASGDLGFYLSTKLCSEILLDNYRSFMDVVSLRFFFVYGKDQRRSMLIPRLVDSVKNGKDIILSGRDGIKITPTHVNDAVMAIRCGLKISGSHKINVAGPETLSLREIGEIIAGKVGGQAKFQLTNTSGSDLIGDTTLMRNLLGVPKMKFEDGILDVL